MKFYRILKNYIWNLYLIPLNFACHHSAAWSLIKEDASKFRGTHNNEMAFNDIIKDKYFRTLLFFRLGVVGRILSFLYPYEKSFHINTPKIGGGFYPAHPYATIIHAKSIGRNFSCRQCTTIGNKIDGRNDLIPSIGDNVNVGANVVIIGNVTIGNNVIIGAGSVVVHDLPNDCVAVGNPCRPISSSK